MDPELHFHITVQKPPQGVDYALQKGSGSVYEHVQHQLSSGGDLHFEFIVRAKARKDGETGFLGPFVQGPPTARFVYIGIGTYSGKAGASWSRRLKVPLSGITREMIAQAIDHPHYRFTTTVPGTAKDGTPTCATVKPFEGWRIT